MEVKFLETIANLGLGGAALASVVAALFYLIKSQASERKDWGVRIEKISDKHNETSKEMTERIIDSNNKTTQVISELKGIISGINHSNK